MPRKPMRSKRKARSVELDGMARMLLYAACRHHLEGSMQLKPVDLATLAELKKTPSQFVEEMFSDMVEADGRRLQNWIEMESKIYAKDQNPHIAEKLRKYLNEAGMDADAYFKEHFPKLIIDFSEAAKARKKR